MGTGGYTTGPTGCSTETVLARNGDAPTESCQAWGPEVAQSYLCRQFWESEGAEGGMHAEKRCP